MRVVPFDVPGHKHGKGNPELVELLGEKCVGIDVNSMKPLDNLCHPVSVIREAEELAAEAFGALMRSSWWEGPHPLYRAWFYPAVSGEIRSSCPEMCTEVPSMPWFSAVRSQYM
mgnify:CR=1 FL=1